MAVVVVHSDWRWREGLVHACLAGGFAAIGAPVATAIPTRVGSAPTRVVVAELEAWIDRRGETASDPRASHASAPRVVLIGASRAPSLMSAAYRAGASSFVGVEAGRGWCEALPLDAETLLRLIDPPEAAREPASISAAAPRSRRRIAEPRESVAELAAIAGHSPAARALRSALAAAARSNATTLLLGETGTGKELAAQALHAASARGHAELFPISCSLPSGVVDSELFGHERGAFTGALERRAGAFELTGAGTLFLDEIGEMAIELQARLLRVLEARTFRRVGGTSALLFEGGVVAATHRDLDREVREGRFREDLFYRLDVERIALPALRDRLEDVVEIAKVFLARFAPAATLSPGAAAALLEPEWRGNVRELRNVIESVGGAQGEGPIPEAAVRRRLARSLPPPAASEGAPSAAASRERLATRPGPGLARTESAASTLDWVDAAASSGVDLDRMHELVVLRTVERFGGNQVAASRQLGVSRYVVRRIVRRARERSVSAKGG